MKRMIRIVPDERGSLIISQLRNRLATLDTPTATEVALDVYRVSRLAACSRRFPAREGESRRAQRERKERRLEREGGSFLLSLDAIAKNRRRRRARGFRRASAVLDSASGRP